MDGDGLLTHVLLGLPQRIEKLERTVREQHLLIGVLLARTGLKPPDEIEHAFAWAQSAWEDIEQTMRKKKRAEWAATPEGKLARKKAEDARAQRRNELWQEECRTERRIVRREHSSSDDSNA